MLASSPRLGAWAILNDPEITKTEVAKYFGVSFNTLSIAL